MSNWCAVLHRFKHASEAQRRGESHLILPRPGRSAVGTWRSGRAVRLCRLLPAARADVLPHLKSLWPITAAGYCSTVARRRSLSSFLIRAARRVDDIEAIASGDPKRVERRAKNRVV